MAYKIRYKILGGEGSETVTKQTTIKAKTKEEAKNKLSERLRKKNASGKIIKIQDARLHGRTGKQKSRS